MQRLSGTVTQDVTSDHLRERARDTILPEPQSAREGGRRPVAAVRAIWEELVQTAPGTAKSRTATQVANQLWERFHEPTLYLMLTHKAIEQRLKFIAEDEAEESWFHYKGHAKDCKVSKWAKYGYSGAQCSCEREVRSLDAHLPTLAALNVIFQLDLSEWPSHPDLDSFPLWIIDEVDLGRFKEEFVAQERDLWRVAANYPRYFEPVKQLAISLLELIAIQQSTELSDHLNSHALYEVLNMVLDHNGLPLPTLLHQLKPIQHDLPRGQWARRDNTGPTDLRGQPLNFAPYLVPIFCEEAEQYIQGRPFNPRIHLVNQGKRAPLQIRWLREVVARSNSSTNLLVLDATADMELMGELLSVRESFQPPLPDWPKNVHVHQWADSSASKAQLGFHSEDDAFGNNNDSKLESWFERIRQSLDGLNRNWRVGVISHKGLHTKLEDRVRSWGFKKVESLYFYDLRGSNDFLKSRILVILGCPIPNLTGFEEEAQAFFYDKAPLDLTKKTRSQKLVMRTGQQYPVSVFGYWTRPASNYYHQKCQAELYQALHRIRPYIPSRYQRHIFLFTNMPVPGVEVDEVLVNTDSNWPWEVAQRVKQALANKEEVTAKVLAESLPSGETTIRSLEKRIGNNGETIAVLAHAHYLRGRSGRGGTANRFAKTPTIS